MKKTLPLQTKDAAKLLDVSTERVRQMEKEGKLRSDRTASGQRLYDEREVQRARAERDAKKK